MATHIIISNEDYIKVDDSQFSWVDKGNAMPSLSSAIHYVIWNNLPGQNEIQTKDPSTGNMAGNTNLSSASDSVETTTVQELLDWAETRKSQMNSATLDYENALENARIVWTDAGNPVDTFNSVEAPLAFDWTKSWIDYDPNYS
jgi:hypothetical protein